MSAARVGCYFVFVVDLMVSLAAAQEWSRFRGPNGSGVSDAKTIPVKWTDSDIRWKVKLPGEGISSPVVWGERIFVTSAEPGLGKRHLICLSTVDGKELWRKLEFIEKTAPHLPTPLAYNGRLFLWTEKGIVTSAKLDSTMSQLLSIGN